MGELFAFKVIHMTLSTEELNNILANNPGLQKRNPDLVKSLGLAGKGQEQETEKKKNPKYLNHKVYVYEDGFVAFENTIHDHGIVTEKYDSLKEYKRYQELLLLQRAGKISDLQRQVKYVIQEAFIYRDEKISEIAYVADHVYIRDGEKIVEDVKGVGKDGKAITATKDFKLKWKLLKAKYPELCFELY